MPKQAQSPPHADSLANYSWCANPDCRNFNVVVPLKYGNTMTCYVCGGQYPVLKPENFCVIRWGDDAR